MNHTAQLNPTSPRYATWRGILATDEVPITTSRPFRAHFGPVVELDAFALDLARLDAGQRTRLVDWITGQFKAGRAGVEAELDQVGFPIRAVDVYTARIDSCPNCGSTAKALECEGCEREFCAACGHQTTAGDLCRRCVAATEASLIV